VEGGQTGLSEEASRPSVWTGRVTGTVVVDGSNSLSSSFDGSFGFTIYLSDSHESVLTENQSIPSNTVAGKMSGGFNQEHSSPDQDISGNGLVSYFLGGMYDRSSETVRIRLRPAGMEASGKQNFKGDPSNHIAPAVAPLSVNWNTGRRSPMDDWYGDIPKETIVLEAPKMPAIHPGRDGDASLLHGVPQTGDSVEESIMLDLRNPNPQTIVYTAEDERLHSVRTTTWTFTLVPLFSIEREGRAANGSHSFLSSDLIEFRVSILGVTIPGSLWEGLISWNVSGVGPYAGNGIPSQASQSAAFAFRPNPSNRPISGSTARNRPISYHVAVTIEGTTQYYFLLQDEVDILRQEYLDYGLSPVPGRGEIVARPIDGRLNIGNYNVVVDDGSLEALDAIKGMLKRYTEASVAVVRGYLSPQRRKFAGTPSDVRPVDTSLDLAPQPPTVANWRALGEACSGAGYSFVYGTESGIEVRYDDPRVELLRVVWPSGSRRNMDRPAPDCVEPKEAA
jgi:hypothetical protein